MVARFTVRSEVDFIALAGVVLGFQPKQSLVMMTVNSFHARIDIPEEADIGECVQALLTPALKHKVGRVAFLLFDDGEHDALKTALIDSFRSNDIQILAALEVGEDRYRPFDGQWMPIDIAASPMTLEAQYLDVAPKHSSRAELVAFVKPLGETATTAVHAAIEYLRTDGIEKSLLSLSREGSKQQAAFWVTAVRSCEVTSDLLSDVALMAAFAGWLSGDGALAWVALDLADDTSTWHRLLSTVLEQAVSPAMWSEVVNSGG